MAAGQADENIFQAGLARGQVQQMFALFLDRVKQRRDGQVRLAHIQADQTIVMADRLDSGKRPPDLDAIAVRVPLT